uniref:HAT C-terminal dimerisation domain-containing protein n=1 Tax=Astyanax mexicanus TaxID=7994 RepID=A0A3B1KK48_ASTMX
METDTDSPYEHLKQFYTLESTTSFSNLKRHIELKHPSSVNAYMHALEDLQPLSKLEKPSFIRLVTGLQPTRHVPSRKQVQGLLNREFNEVINKLKTDCWSDVNKGFMSITVHWLDKDDPSLRKSAALACRRVRGSHTYDVLEKVLTEVNKEFKIQNKIVCTVTDNASNFVKAFNCFGEGVAITAAAAAADETVEEASVQAIDSLDDGDGDDDDDGLEPAPLSALEDPCLPPHRRCMTLTLNRVAADTKNVTDRQYNTLARPVFSKASTLTPQASDLIAPGHPAPEYDKLLLSKPTATEGLAVCRPLIQTMIQAKMICKRLDDRLEEKENILAAVLLPMFKLDWVSDDIQRLQYRVMLKQEVQSISVVESGQAQSSATERKSSASSFFKFSQSPATVTKSEVDMYLDAPTADNFNEYTGLPKLKKLFVKYNTAIPSSAPVERLFSTGGQIFRPRRNRLGDTNFEKQLVLNANKKLFGLT